MKYYRLLILAGLILISFFNKTYAQTEVEAWGNLKGIRISGQLINFESSIDMINTDWSK